MTSVPVRREGLIGGRYALHNEIASGGMATVHFGRLLGPAGFSRIVAIKRLHPQLARELEFVSMFIDEVRLAARIQHPNVVATLDVVDDAGELFLVMEYVHGESLGRLIKLAARRGRPIPPAIAATIIAGLLHGLHAAHEAKTETNVPLELVHRDVSPQNVLVGVDGVARVLDFGIAKAVGRLQTTRAGQIKGKMAYLAPEHVRGGPIDRRTDIYGAAVVLWEALTGVQLFDGENDAIVLARVLAGQIPAPSAFARNIGRSLETITMRGLEREPEGRFATAREMALALQQDVGLVAPSEVGDWVSELARESLAGRTRYLTDLEQISARDQQLVQTLGLRPSSPPTPPVPPRPDPDDGPSTRAISPPGAVDAAPVERRPENAEAVDGSAHPVVSVVDGARHSAPPQSTRRRRNARMAFSVAALAIVIGLLAARTATSTDPQVTAIDRPTVLVSPAPEVPAPAPLAAPPLELAANPAVVSVPPTASAPVRAPAARAAVPSVEGGRGPSIARPSFNRSTARPPDPVVTPVTSATPVRRGCRPPYVIDTAGIKRFKVECL